MLTKKERFQQVIQYFSAHQPKVETELRYKNPYQLLVAVILSAQCTDKRVNLITPDFFRALPDLNSLSKASFEQVFGLIKSCSYPNNKSKHLIGMAKKVVNDYDGHIPKEVNELQTLPGVGRKTAHVFLSVVYKKPVMAVDTHVFRVSHRVGLVSNAKTPLQVETQLTKYIPREQIVLAHHWLILHGRYVCLAKKPKCEECGIKTICKLYNS